MSLIVTLGFLAGQLVLLGLCLLQARKPIDPLRPKLMPYRLLILVLVVTSLATTAHLLSIYTGNPIAPRRKMGM